MKKNSFKRFLAVTLAAATALTFAPVSTLGLTGVVQAQATAIDATHSFSDSQTAITAGATVYIAVGEEKELTLNNATASDAITYGTAGKNNDTAVADVTRESGEVKLKGNKAGVLDVTQTVSGSTTKYTVVVYDLSSILAATDSDVVLSVNGSKQLVNSYTFADSAKAKYTATVGSTGATFIPSNGTLYAGATAKATPDNVVVTVKAGSTEVGTITYSVTTVASDAKVTFGADTTDVAGKSVTYTWDADNRKWTPDPTTAAGKLAVTAEGGTADFTVGTANSAIATASISTGTVTIAPVTAINGKVASTKLYIYPSSAAQAADTKNTGKGALTSVDINFNVIQKNTITATDVTNDGTQSKFSFELTKASLMNGGTVKYLDASGNDASQYFIDHSNTAFSSQTGDFTVSTSAAPTGKYTVQLLNSTKKILAQDTFDVIATSNAASEAASGTFTYGGVLNSIYAYKGATYDLAEHASINYNGINYSGSELNWYLIDASKTPKQGETRSDLKSIQLPASAGTVSDGAAGSLKITVSDPDEFKVDVAGATVNTRVVAEAVVNGVRTVVYVGSTDFSVTTISDNVVKKVIEVTAGVQGTGFASRDTKIDTLDTKIANPTKDNIYLKASDVNYPVETPEFAQTDANYSLTVKLGSGDDNPFKGSYLTLNNGDKLATGTYYETEYIPFKVGGKTTTTVYLLKVNSTISVNTGVNFRVKDEGSILASTYASDSLKIATDRAVYLNLVDTKTWNIKDHIETDVADISKVSFTYSSDSANVDVDGNGVLTAKSVGNAEITIKAKYNGIETWTTLLVRVNQNGFDTVTVTGADGDVARVLNPRDYNNNAEIPTEYLLVTKQIPYVQIEITGNETTNKVETPVVVSKNNAKLSYSFVKDYTSKGLTIDPSTGKITIDYNKCTDGNSTKDATAMGVYAVKVVSNATNTSADTTSYYYVVVDYPDKTISGLQSNYTVGSCSANDDHSDAVEMSKESKGSAEKFTIVNKNTDDFNGKTYYQADDVNSYQFGVDFTNSGIITRAYTAGKTMHVVAYNPVNDGSHTGYTAKLISLSSAAAVDNYVEKITNKDTGEVLYDHSVNATDTARELKIDKATTIQVTLAHPVASVVSGSAVGLKIASVDDNNHIYNETPYVTAVVNSKEVDVALYPNSKGTTVIQVGPIGHLTATDRTDIHHKFVNVAVTYTGENSATATKPAKVTGVKLGNKKGAKVVVKFNKDNTSKNIKYYVQKKVGKKTSGKSVGSNRTILSVAKGKTVKVRVKAYYYDANGLKHVGKYSKWVTKKTDKK